MSRTKRTNPTFNRTDSWSASIMKSLLESSHGVARLSGVTVTVHRVEFDRATLSFAINDEDGHSVYETAVSSVPVGAHLTLLLTDGPLALTFNPSVTV